MCMYIYDVFICEMPLKIVISICVCVYVVIKFLINKRTGRQLYKHEIMIRNEQNQTLICNQVTLERPGIDQLNFSYFIYNKQN